MTKDQMFAPGDQIGAYVIKSQLGAGGMGAVYLAEHRHIDRKAAIKVLLPELSSREDVVSRFFAEARATSRILHPGIVDILDCDVHSSGRAYIVMEYLPGENLGAAIAHAGCLDVPEALRITAEIASALDAAHGKGIVHRDLKPDNVFLTPSNDVDAPPIVKILDFGIAKLIESGEVARTKTGSLLGTPLYMSPEQCRGAGRVDNRADIYSLGCILFEMIAGHPPFQLEGMGELIMAHMSEPAPDVGAHARSPIPEGVRALVARMLQKDAADRPQSMREVAGAADRISVSIGGRGPVPTLIMPPRDSEAVSSTARELTARNAAPSAAGAAAAGGTQVMSRDQRGATAVAIAEPDAAAEATGARRRAPSRADVNRVNVTTLSQSATELAAAGISRRPRALTVALSFVALGVVAFGAKTFLSSRAAATAGVRIAAGSGVAASVGAGAATAPMPAPVPAAPAAAAPTPVVAAGTPATPPSTSGSADDDSPTAHDRQAVPAPPKTDDAAATDEAHASRSHGEHDKHRSAGHHEHRHHGATAGPAIPPPVTATARAPAIATPRPTAPHGYRALDDD